jgi:hypothetical protein
MLITAIFIRPYARLSTSSGAPYFAANLLIKLRGCREQTPVQAIRIGESAEKRFTINLIAED